jgi:hypothetical protein
MNETIAYSILVRKPEGKLPLGKTDVDGWVILIWILAKWDGVVWAVFIWLRIGTRGGLL